MLNIANLFDSENKEIKKYNLIVNKIISLSKKIEDWSDSKLKEKIEEYIDKTRAISDYKKQQDYLNQIIQQYFLIKPKLNHY